MTGLFVVCRVVHDQYVRAWVASFEFHLAGVEHDQYVFLGPWDLTEREAHDRLTPSVVASAYQHYLADVDLSGHPVQ